MPRELALVWQTRGRGPRRPVPPRARALPRARQYSEVGPYRRRTHFAGRLGTSPRLGLQVTRHEAGEERAADRSGEERSEGQTPSGTLRPHPGPEPVRATEVADRGRDADRGGTAPTVQSAPRSPVPNRRVIASLIGLYGDAGRSRSRRSASTVLGSMAGAPRRRTTRGSRPRAARSASASSSRVRLRDPGGTVLSQDRLGSARRGVAARGSTSRACAASRLDPAASPACKRNLAASSEIVASVRARACASS